MTDVIIIGAGPAGLNAALYAARKELSAQVVSTDIGGQMLLTGEIENYLGLPHISGFELADKMEAHAKEYPVDFVFAGVLSTEKDSEGHFLVHLDDGKVLMGRTLIVTAGKRSRTLDIPGEMEYTGRGVSYCATCDGPFYRKKTRQSSAGETVRCRLRSSCHVWRTRSTSWSEAASVLRRSLHVALRGFPM